MGPTAPCSGADAHAVSSAVEEAPAPEIALPLETFATESPAAHAAHAGAEKRQIAGTPRGTMR